MTDAVRRDVENHVRFVESQDIPELRKTRAKKSRYVPTETQVSLLAGMPKRVARFVRKSIERGDDLLFKSKAREGDNPFDALTARSLHCAYQKALSGPVSRGMLTTHFAEELGWQKTSASVETTFAWRVMKVLNLAIEREGMLFVGPDICREN